MTETVAPQPRGLGAEIWDAVRGRPRDYTQGPIPRAVLLLAIPMVLEMSMQSVFSIADMYFVGFLGPEAQAVVGLCDSLLGIVFAVAIGLSMGAAAMVARRIGEKKPEDASLAAVQAIAVGLLFAAVSGVAGVLLARPLLMLLGNDAVLADYGRDFTAIMLGGNVTVTLLFLINAIFRGAGRPTAAMWALFVANGLNVILDPLLIFGVGPFPRWGLEGAAIATNVSRGVGVLLQLWLLTQTDGAVRVSRAVLRLKPAVMARLVRVSAIGVLQFMISTTSFIGLFLVLSGFGAQVLAGYAVAIRIIIFVLLPVWGVANAAATLVGQNLGAGQPDRAERSVWMAARWNSLLLFGVMIVFLLAGRALAAPFSDDPAVIDLAARCLWIVALSYPFWGFGMVTVLAFNGAGDTATPTWIHLIAYWLLQLPLAYGLAEWGAWGPSGVFAAITLSQATLAGIGVAWFRRGRWRQQVI